MTVICDECKKTVKVAGRFVFTNNENKTEWEGDLCPDCQIALIKGKPLTKR
jgi:hypothetical protein